jgi:hypothetical protein
MQTWTIYTYAKAAASPGRMVRPSDGVTWHDGVTSDVIGRLAPELPVWELVLGIKNLAPAQDVDLPLAYP